MICNEPMGPFVGSLPDHDTALAIVAGDGAVLLAATSGREPTGPKSYHVPLAHEIWINSVLVGWKKAADESESEFWSALVGKCYALASVLLRLANGTKGVPDMLAVVIAGPDVDDLATVYFHSLSYESPL